jgi:hypothetical protein
LLVVSDFSRCGQGDRQFVRTGSSLPVILDFLVLWLIAAAGVQAGVALESLDQKTRGFMVQITLSR